MTTPEPLPASAGSRRDEEGRHYVVATVGPVEFTLHESTILPGVINVQVAGDLNETPLRIHVNDQLVWDALGAGGDIAGLDDLTGADRAEAYAVALADAIREAVMAAYGRHGNQVTGLQLLDAAFTRCGELYEDLPAETPQAGAA